MKTISGDLRREMQAVAQDSGNFKEKPLVLKPPADRAEIGDRSQLGQGAVDRERRTRIDQDAVRTVGDEIGVALEMVIIQSNSHPPHTRGNFDGIVREGCRLEPLGGSLWTGSMQ